MPVLKIREYIFIHFGERSRALFWTKLSKFILNKYGEGPFNKIEIVSTILNDSFQFYITEFDSILKKENSRSFYNYVYTIMECGIKMWRDYIGGVPLEQIEMTDFATNQRTIRLILEQATDLKIKTDNITTNDMPILTRKLEDLIFLGYWIYGFAEIISEIKIIGNCYEIFFDKDNILNFKRKEPYNFIFTQLIDEILSGYNEAIFNEENFDDLVNALKNCLGIEYGKSIQLALELKKQVCAHNVDYCTYPFDLLPKNYNHIFSIDYQVANDYYSGLTITRNNKLSIEKSVLKANSLERYFYRPFLELNIDGEDRVLISPEKVSESIVSISINVINWNKAPKEWEKYDKFRKFLQIKSNFHDKTLENQIQNILIENNIYFDRNIVSLKPLKGNQIRIDVRDVGEIDFLYLDSKRKQIIVADSKYIIAKYDMIAYRLDYTKFTEEYEPKLKNKIDFVSNNTKLVQEHFQIITGNKNIDLSDYTVDGLFLVNTPTIYNYVGKYRAYHLLIFKNWISGVYNPTQYLTVINNKAFHISEPYFKNAIEASNS